MTTRAGASKRRESRFKADCVRWARARGIPVAKLTECVGIPDVPFHAQVQFRLSTMNLSPGCIVIEPGPLMIATPGVTKPA